MEVVKEMQELRDELDRRGIEWVDISEDYGELIREAAEKEGELDLYLYELIKHEWFVRTHFNYKGHHVSCINGFGSYGGFDMIRSVAGEYRNLGLIEMMIDSNNDPIGYLTCEDVFKILDELEEGREKCKKHQL